MNGKISKKSITFFVRVNNDVSFGVNFVGTKWPMNKIFIYKNNERIYIKPIGFKYFEYENEWVKIQAQLDESVYTAIKMVGACKYPVEKGRM